MDYYRLSDEPIQAARLNKENGLYRMSVHMSTLAIDVLLKSVLFRMNQSDSLIMSHNHLGIVDVIESRYPRRDHVRHAAKLSRKYFKDSRYSNSENFPIFTKELAEAFIGYAELIKKYVDTECQSTLEDMQKKHARIRLPFSDG
ncbi:MAG: HEPN domain-containing protein [Defluviitaleaceae bacterium]|nr:HEPN domain-containing protein [Defluviitaleaceae bacterium]